MLKCFLWRCISEVTERHIVYCHTVYDVALWSSYHSHASQKFSSAYVKCLKLLFFGGFHKLSSVSVVFTELGSPACGRHGNRHVVHPGISQWILYYMTKVTR